VISSGGRIPWQKAFLQSPCKADKKTKAVKTKDGCKDTRMLSVRRREATGGDLVAGSMLWTLEMGVAPGGGGGGAAVENGPTLDMP
jgi:hypothetical protein